MTGPRLGASGGEELMIGIRGPFTPVRNLEDAQAMFRRLGLGTAGMRVLDCTAEFDATLRILGNSQPMWLNPPIVVQVPDEAIPGFFRRISPNARPAEVTAFHIFGTNVVVVSESAINGTSDEVVGAIHKESSHAGPNTTVCHEMLHYLSRIADGAQMQYRRRGRDASWAMPSWLDEGIVEAISEGEFGRVQDSINYPAGVFVAAMLESIAGGPDALREAFIWRDFRPVQEAVDGALGEGTFEMLLGQPPTPGGGRITNAYEALDFLLRRAEERPGSVDLDSLERDPRVVRAIRTVYRFLAPGRAQERRTRMILEGEDAEGPGGG